MARCFGVAIPLRDAHLDYYRTNKPLIARFDFHKHGESENWDFPEENPAQERNQELHKHIIHSVAVGFHGRCNRRFFSNGTPVTIWLNTAFAHARGSFDSTFAISSCSFRMGLDAGVNCVVADFLHQRARGPVERHGLVLAHPISGNASRRARPETASVRVCGGRRSAHGLGVSRAR